MPKRRLVLARESLAVLESDELASVAGAISTPHPLCIVRPTAMHTGCYSCGMACTYNCPETG